MEKVKCKVVAMLNGDGYENMLEADRRVYSVDGASPAVCTVTGGNKELKIAEPKIAAMRGRNPDNPSDRTAGIHTEQRLEVNGSGTSNTLTTVQKDNLVVEPNVGDGWGENDVRVIDGKAYIYIDGHWCRVRKLTPCECWRLMDFGDEDFDKVKAAGISDSQCYKTAGNSIVVSVLEALFKEML